MNVYDAVDRAGVTPLAGGGDNKKQGIKGGEMLISWGPGGGGFPSESLPRPI